MDRSEFLMSEFANLDYKFEKTMPEHQKGLYYDGVVYLNPNQSEEELTSTIAEEIGHHLTSSGNIVLQNDLQSRQQEKKARDIGSMLTVSLKDIIDCFNDGLTTSSECADQLSLTVPIFETAIEVYREKYPNGTWYQNYFLNFKATGQIQIKKYANQY